MNCRIWPWGALLAGLLCRPDAAAAAPPSELAAPSPDARRVAAAVNWPFALTFRAPLVRRSFYRQVHRSFGRPAIVARERQLVVATGDGDVVGLSLEDGHVQWVRSGTEAFETAATAFDAGVGQLAVLVSSRSGDLLAIDPRDGSLRWQLHLDADVRAPAQQVGDTLYMSTSANRVVAVDAAQGTLKWSQGRSPPTGLTVDGHARPAIDGERLYASFSDGFLMAIDRQHGEALWSRPLSLRGGPFVDADADPLVVGGRLFAASYSDGVYAIDPADGHTLWERAAAAPVSLATYDDLLIVGSADGWIWAFAQSDGKLVWRLRLSAGPVSRLLIDGEQLLATAGRAGLVVVAPRDGRPLQASDVGESILGDPVVGAGVVAAIGGSGHVYAWRR